MIEDCQIFQNYSMMESDNLICEIVLKLNCARYAILMIIQQLETRVTYLPALVKIHAPSSLPVKMWLLLPAPKSGAVLHICNKNATLNKNAGIMLQFTREGSRDICRYHQRNPTSPNLFCSGYQSVLLLLLLLLVSQYYYLQKVHFS